MQDDDDNLSQAGAADDDFDETQRHYEALLVSVASFPELAMRCAALDQALKPRSLPQIAWCIDQMIRGSLWGQEEAMDAMQACAMWLLECRMSDDYEFFQTLYEEAHHSQRPGVLLMIRDAPAHRSLVKGKKLPEIRLATERETTLGQRRTMASGADRKHLERLLFDPSPLVLTKLLNNSHVRLAEVISAVASRRPTTPELLTALATHHKWFKHHQVREALALNPFNATGVSLKLLPTLHIRSLRQLANAGDVHPLITESAALLVRLREERTAPWRV